MNPMVQEIRAEIARRRPKESFASVARKAKLNRNVFQNQMDERTALDIETIAKVRDALKMPATWPQVPRIPVNAITPMPTGNLRVLGSVGAGDGADAIDEDSIPVPLSMCGADRVGWIVEGESMLPMLQPGDIAIFKASPQPRQNYPNLVRTPEGKYRTKIAKVDERGYVLRSLNPSFEDEPGAVEWKGYLVGIYRVIGFREEMIHDPGGLRPE